MPTSLANHSLTLQPSPRPAVSVAAPGTATGLRVLRNTMMRCALVAGTLAVYFLFFSVICSEKGCGRASLILIQTAGLVTLSVSFVLLAIGPLRREPVSIFTPVLPFILSTALFFGFGSLSSFFVGDVAQSFVMAGNYFIDEYGLLRTNTMTMFGVTILLLSMSFASRFKIRRTGIVPMRLSTSFIGLLFLGLGLFIKFGLILPSRWGVTTWVAPGILTNLAQLSDLGFALVAYCAVRGSRGLRLLFWLLWPPYLAVTLLEFAKTPVVFAILLPALGSYIAHRRVRRVVPWLLLAGALFAITQNVNLSARSTVIAIGGGENQAPFGTRVEILIDELSVLGSQSSQMSVVEKVPGMWWVRLNYAGPQLRAMELYDAGTRAKWEVSPLLYFVPRIIWPNKPIVASPGQLFNRLVSGNDTTIGRVAITIYAEGYWFFGWAGTALFAAMTGVVMGAIARQTYTHMAARNYIFLPAAFLGMQMGGLGVNGFFQTNILGSLSVYLGYIFLIWLSSLAIKAISQR